MAVEWLRDHFAEHSHLNHLRARRRGKVVTVESGPADDPVRHVRFRRDTVHLWILEMPIRGGKWDRTPFRAQIEELMDIVETQFPWTLAPIHAPNADGTSDPGY
ncbi:MAG: hypothetical protein D6790_19145 [Caldilineae bacterium]|nr:MAG: hypothetical protein D6790_19145 [Caldilineae bacterium]